MCTSVILSSLFWVWLSAGLLSSHPLTSYWASAHTTLSHSTTQPFATLLLSTPARLVSQIQIKSINQSGSYLWMQLGTLVHRPWSTMNSHVGYPMEVTMCTSKVTLPLIPCTSDGVTLWCAVILCPPDLVLVLVRSGPVIPDLGGSVHIWGGNGPVLISYFCDGAAPVKVFRTAHRAIFIIWIISVLFPFPPHPNPEGKHDEHARDVLYVGMRLR